MYLTQSSCTPIVVKSVYSVLKGVDEIHDPVIWRPTKTVGNVNSSKMGSWLFLQKRVQVPIFSVKLQCGLFQISHGSWIKILPQYSLYESYMYVVLWNLPAQSLPLESHLPSLNLFRMDSVSLSTVWRVCRLVGFWDFPSHSINVIVLPIPRRYLFVTPSTGTTRDTVPVSK